MPMLFAPIHLNYAHIACKLQMTIFPVDLASQLIAVQAMAVPQTADPVVAPASAVGVADGLSYLQ